MKQNNNMQFCLLSALGIFMVVDGHLNNSYLDIGGLFQYYSFHMQLFIFISGYFYRAENEAHVGNYIKRKFMRLMVPYFVWNLLYGLLAQFLRGYGFSFGEPVTLENLFIEPFRLGYQFIFNHAAWFVPTLFLVEIANIALSKALARIPHRDYVRAVLYFFMGILGIHLSKTVGTDGFWLTAIKVLFLLPFYGLGALYHNELEKKDHIRNRIYFPVLLILAMLLVLSGKPLIYAVSHCNAFPGYLLPYMVSLLGIAFWLRVSRILAPAFQNSSFIQYWGRNTYPVMMHHMMVFFMIKTVYALLSKYGGWFSGFDFNSYKTDFYYCFLPRGISQFKVFYLLAGILIPLCLHRCFERFHSTRSSSTVTK